MALGKLSLAPNLHMLGFERAPSLHRLDALTHCANLPACLPALQIDNEGVPNGLKLGEFLADSETKAVMRDRDCVRTPCPTSSR